MRQGFVKSLVGALFAVALGATPAQAAPILYGVTFGNQLITIDTTTGAGTLVGNLTEANMFPLGLGVVNGRLYTFDQSADLLKELNPATAATISSINLGFGTDIVGEGGLDFRSDGVGFLNSTGGNTSTIFQFTTTAGSGTTVGTTGGVAGLDGLAFNSADVLYGLGQDPQNNLYTVNQTTGALTLIGATGVSGSSAIGGLDFLGSTLFGVINSSLYTINTSTGAATLIGSTGFNVSGIAFLDTQPNVIPEPASLILMGSGLLGLAARRRRRRAV
jgi:hypothetical protein